MVLLSPYLPHCTPASLTIPVSHLQPHHTTPLQLVLIQCYPGCTTTSPPPSQTPHYTTVHASLSLLPTTTTTTNTTTHPLPPPTTTPAGQRGRNSSLFPRLLSCIWSGVFIIGVLLSCLFTLVTSSRLLEGRAAGFSRCSPHHFYSTYLLLEGG